MSLTAFTHEILSSQRIPYYRNITKHFNNVLDKQLRTKISDNNFE